MNLLYCIPHLYNSGGMERVLTQKVNWLAAHTDYTITIVTTEPTPTGTPKCYFPLSEKVQVVELNIDFNADYTKPLLPKYCAHMRIYSAARDRTLHLARRQRDSFPASPAMPYDRRDALCHGPAAAVDRGEP